MTSSLVSSQSKIRGSEILIDVSDIVKMLKNPKASYDTHQPKVLTIILPDYAIRPDMFRIL